MIYVKKAVLHHAYALTLRGSGTMLDEMKFHSNFQNWLLYPFTQVHWLRLLSLAGMLLLWQIINAAGFFSEVVKSKLNQGMRHDKTR
jgi:hypothetical protein